MITRYDYDWNGNLIPSPDGELVRYEDYQQARREALEEANEALATLGIAKGKERDRRWAKQIEALEERVRELEAEAFTRSKTPCDEHCDLHIADVQNAEQRLAEAERLLRESDSPHSPDCIGWRHEEFDGECDCGLEAFYSTTQARSSQTDQNQSHPSEGSEAD